MNTIHRTTDLPPDALTIEPHTPAPVIQALYVCPFCHRICGSINFMGIPTDQYGTDEWGWIIRRFVPAHGEDQKVECSCGAGIWLRGSPLFHIDVLKQRLEQAQHSPELEEFDEEALHLQILQ